MHVYSSEQEKIDAAKSATPNENQNHCYSADETPGHIQADAVNQGEHQPRVVEVKQAGHHITQPQKADGQKQKANVDREASVMANRKASEKIFADARKPHSSAK